MKTISEQQQATALVEQLLQAVHSVGFAADHLKDAHRQMCNNGNQFGEIVVLELLGEAVKLQQKIDRALAAAK